MVGMIMAFECPTCLAKMRMDRWQNGKFYISMISLTSCRQYQDTWTWNMGLWISYLVWKNPDSNVHGANVGPILGPQVPGGPRVGPMRFAIWKPFRIAYCNRKSNVIAICVHRFLNKSIIII